jgi:hypothetical protein
LDIAGYSKGAVGSGVDTDDRGFCPQGERYNFEILNGSKQIQNFWATSCGGQGTFKGNVPTVINLFMAQMPDYNNVINGTDIF